MDVFLYSMHDVVDANEKHLDDISCNKSIIMIGFKFVKSAKMPELL